LYNLYVISQDAFFLNNTETFIFLKNSVNVDILLHKNVNIISKSFTISFKYL